MKKLLILLTIGIFLIPILVLGDGMVLPDYEEKVYLPNQKAVITWDGEEEVMILSTKIKTDNLANMAWVIPIPSKVKPEIEKGDIDIFYDLADLFRRDRKAPGFMGVEGPDKGVEVIEFKKVDIYDITTLKATDAGALVDWLNANGYIVPESVTPVFQEYCDQEDFYFIANKINLANKYKDLTITDEDRVCAKIVADYYEGYTRIDEQKIYWALEDMDGCKEATFEAVNVLVELAQGIATPIKITFQPQVLFYPLKISSVNEGDTIVDVYVFSKDPVKDKSEILSVSQMVKNTASRKEAYEQDYGISGDYITYLTYVGSLKDLKSDSWFGECNYNPKLDPKYESWWDKILPTIFYIIMILILLAIPTFFIIGLVVVVQKIVEKFKRKD